MKIHRPHLIRTGLSSSVSPVRNLISTTVISNDAFVTFTGLFEDNYDRYEMELIQVVPITDLQEAALQTSVDNGTTWQTGATTYASTLNIVESDGTVLVDNVEDDQLALSSFDAGEGISNTANEQGLNGVARMYLPSGSYQFSAVFQGWYKDPAGINKSWHVVAGGRNQTDAVRVNAVRLKMNSGNLSSGTVRLYGIR